MPSSPTLPVAQRHTVTCMDTLLVVGDGPVCDKLVPMAQLLGWQVHATAGADEALSLLSDARALVVTSHDAEVSGAVLKAALAAGVGYIGQMGSRPGQQKRRAWLIEHGVSEEAQAAIHGPAGLDIAADAPAEIALSILAELVCVLRDGRATSLRDRPGPIHPELEPGEAFCPVG